MPTMLRFLSIAAMTGTRFRVRELCQTSYVGTADRIGMYCIMTLLKLVKFQRAEFVRIHHVSKMVL
jgi:hypothetical protein